ncbi:MAG: reverse transcriptase domain-containing protein [Bacillota bacterium]|nr:reverse transcriptase domain-containing protein [Bacillota bacterium]
MEDGEIQPNKGGTPQGGSISVLLSNIYLHYSLDLWFEKIVKPRLKGEAYLIRYIDDFVIYFQYRADAKCFQEALELRLRKFSLELEPSKSRLVEFGRYTAKWSREKDKKLETIYFLGFIHYCPRNSKGNFIIGRKTEKTKLKRIITKLNETQQDIRHWSIEEQAAKINQILRGHYAYYGIAVIFNLHIRCITGQKVTGGRC